MFQGGEGPLQGLCVGFDSLVLHQLYRGMVYWYDYGLQNRQMGFDSLFPCQFIGEVPEMD